VVNESRREWAVRSRSGAGELVLPARGEQDAYLAADLVRPAEGRVVEVVSQEIGPWQTEAERQEQDKPVIVYLPEVTRYQEDEPDWTGGSTQYYGAFTSLNGALKALEEIGIFRPDHKLMAKKYAEYPRKDDDPRPYIVHPSHLTSNVLREIYGVVMRIRTAVLQP
jgi:hypothetical protein